MKPPRLVGTIKRYLQGQGIVVSRVPKPGDVRDMLTPLLPPERKVVDLDRLASLALGIPGMTSIESGKFLFMLSSTQQIEGNVVEVGSWQGRSTVFLAAAQRFGGTGKLYAVDHFRGNVGKESEYQVGDAGLSDLRANFERNLRSVGLWDEVEVLDMPNTEAAGQVEGPVRFLFIDGDHTRKGVETDVDLFFPKLREGSIVVFDDFSQAFDGLVAAVDDLLASRAFRRVFTYKNTLVVML